MTFVGYTLLVVSKSMTLVIGSFIFILTFLSYKRHKQKLMLHISIGFLLITLGSFIEGILYEVLNLNISFVHIVESLFILMGMIIIAYSLNFGGENN